MWSRGCAGASGSSASARRCVAVTRMASQYTCLRAAGATVGAGAAPMEHNVMTSTEDQHGGVKRLQCSTGQRLKHSAETEEGAH